MKKHPHPVAILIPAVLIVFGAAEVFLRFLPAESYAFRAWEAVVLRVPVAGGPFIPNVKYFNPRSYGDLSASANRRDMRVYRAERFEADAAGYRNPASAGKAPDIILLGDSFMAGCGNSDPDTFGPLLSARLGRPVYNAAGVELRPGQLGSVISSLGSTHGVVIYQHLERYAAPSRFNARAARLGTMVAKTMGPKAWLWIRMRISREFLIAPLQIMSQRLYKTLSDGWLLPNSYEAGVPEVQTWNGGRLLVRVDEIREAHRDRRSWYPAWEEYFDDLRAKLDAMGFKLIVLLVPEKYTVYEPWLVHHNPAAVNDQTYLDGLALRLKERGLSVVNASPVLRRKAGEYLQRGEYLYWPDDTHWNRNGIQETVNAVMEQVGGVIRKTYRNEEIGLVQ